MRSVGGGFGCGVGYVGLAELDTDTGDDSDTGVEEGREEDAGGECWK